MRIRTGTPRAGSLALAAGGALLAALVLAVPGCTVASGSSHGTSDRSSSASPQLVIDPVSWWMITGNVSPFVGTWVDSNPACVLSPYWFRWSIAGGSAEGSLDPTTGATVNFTATSVASGATTLIVRSAAILECGSQTSAVVAAAESNVTVATAVSIQNLSISPNPVIPGESASLHGNVSGGEPPYSLRVAWGDGAVSSVSLPVAGTFGVSHTFPPGNYRPLLAVTDSSGLVAQGTAGTTLTVSVSLAAGLTSDRSEADVGMVVYLNASVLQEPPGASTDWSCSPSVPAISGQAPASTNFACRFPQPGVGVASFEVLPPGGLQPVTATMLVSVVPLPTLSPSAPNITAEIGQPCLVGFAISGGVPPFSLDWVTTGAPNGSSVVIAADGTVWLPVTPVNTGSLELVARLVDADGATALNATVPLRVDPALGDSISSDRETTPLGAALALTGSVTAGAPPFLWLVTPGVAPINESNPTGSLLSVGSFVWSATYGVEGSTTVTVVVVDAAGGFTTTRLELEAVTPLEVNVSVDDAIPSAPDTFFLSLSFSGGLPPFSVDVNASDGQRWNRTSSFDGEVTWPFTCDGSGLLDLRVVTTDTVGGDFQWNGTVEITGVTAPPSEPAVAASSSPSISPTVGVLLGIGCFLAGYYVFRRRTSRSSSGPMPDPVSVLRRIIEPADGADRPTVELLAEEAGIPLDIVRSTIDRLIVAGSIRAETGPDGEEVVSWSGEPPP